MNNNELNDYIKHYIEHDKTNRAIMLTASWGTGKSYYVKNILKPFLEEKKNGKHKCVIVSLYGLNDVSQISKAIYMELRSFKFKKKHEVLTTASAAASIVPRTIFNAMTSRIGYDIGHVSDRQLRKVYKSINLNKKLLVFEDIERTQIDIIELLGYINNMCENDGVKVLLVTNEDELLTTYYETDSEGKSTKHFTNSAIAYKRAKEKTVGDTIYYQCDSINAIKEIIHQFDNALSPFENDECAEEIFEIMAMSKCYNLRSFLIACQKTSDILSKISKDEMDFNKTIFYSIISFSLMMKNGSFPEWNGTDLVSPDLGISKYPLYRFCYNYIRWQELNIDDIDDTLKAHKRMLLYDKHGSKNDTDLNTIYSYLENEENDVIDALTRIEKRLDDPEEIPFYDYRKLAYFLIECNVVLGFDYSSCKTKMIKNITGKNSEIDEELLFLPISDFIDEHEKKMYHAFIDELKTALNKKTKNGCSYNPNKISGFHNQLIQNKGSIVKNHKFLSEFDIDKIAEMIFRCSPAQLQEFRSIMFSVYRNANSYDFIEEDIIAMKSLKDKVKERIDEYGSRVDKIVLKQYHLIIENIDEFITKLSGNQ